MSDTAPHAAGQYVHEIALDTIMLFDWGFYLSQAPQVRTRLALTEVFKQR